MLDKFAQRIQNANRFLREFISRKNTPTRAMSAKPGCLRGVLDTPRKREAFNQ